MRDYSILLSGKGLSLLVVSGLFVCGLLLWKDEPDKKTVLSQPAEHRAEMAVHEKTPVEQAGPVTMPGIEKKQDGFDFDAEMKLRLRAISDAYAEQAQYPSFSVPIEAEELATKYLPDMPIATELPADLTNPDSPSLSIKPGQFRYFDGDTLTALAGISGLPVGEKSYLSARLLLQGKTLSYADIEPSKEQAHLYQLSFEPLLLDNIEWKENITIEVEFHVLDETYTRSVTVEYINTIAKVEDIASPDVQEDYLIIPVYVSTEKPGYHRLQANLYDAVSGKPLVHLTAEDQLVSTSGLLNLQAHISALKVSGSEGPYHLKDIMLRRLPSEPDYITEFGRVEKASFEVEGYRFSTYQDKPYINQKAQRIANELRKLGS